MSSVNPSRLLIAVVLLILFAPACLSFSDDSAPAQQVTLPASAGTATTLPTATVLVIPTPTATESLSPTAKPEPYPGITMPFPAGDCDATPMTGWRAADGVLAAWIEGDGIDVGVPDGLLYEGENSLQWRGDGSAMQFSAGSADGSLLETRSLPVSGVNVEGHVVSSYVTFESSGCWRISAEQGANHVDATVAVYAAACRPEVFDLERCPAPPFALHWNPEHSAPTGCDATGVTSVLTGFVNAVNYGDVEAALAFFPERDQETDIDTTGLRWFSLEKMVAQNPDELRTLLTRLINGGEQLRLLRLDMMWGWDGGAHFGVQMTRETDELLRYRIEGKGAVNCELGQLYLFSAIRQS